MDGMMRIGELSRRTGVSPELLRAWEQRYQLLEPTRSPGGFRLYSVEDEARVRRTTELLEQGLSAAEAARIATAEPGGGAAPARSAVADLSAELEKALARFDTSAGHAAMDRILGAVSVEFALAEILIPYLRDLGDRWAAGEVTVAQEHFASNLIRGRLLGLTRDWGSGGPSSAVLACIPGEAHDLGLVLLGVLIARRGWRVTFLGADTPLDTLEASLDALRPTHVVLATYDAALFRRHADAIAALATAVPLSVLAPVDEQAITDTGARVLPHDLAEAAALLPRH